MVEINVLCGLNHDGALRGTINYIPIRVYKQLRSSCRNKADGRLKCQLIISKDKVEWGLEFWTHWADCYLPKIECMHTKLANSRLPADKKNLHMKEEEKEWLPRFKFWGPKGRSLLISYLFTQIHWFNMLLFLGQQVMVVEDGSFFFPQTLYLVNE